MEIDINEYMLFNYPLDNIDSNNNNNDSTVINDIPFCLLFCLKAKYKLINNKIILCYNCQTNRNSIIIEYVNLHYKSCNCDYNLVNMYQYLFCHKCKTPVHTMEINPNTCFCFNIPEIVRIHKNKTKFYKLYYIPGITSNLLCYDDIPSD